MDDLLKNPVFVFLAGLIILWLAFKVLSGILSIFGIFVLAFILLYFFSDRFRRTVRLFLESIFRR